MNYVFAGDRDISVWVLRYLVERGDLPAALLVSDPSRASHASELRELCAHLPDEMVLTGREFREERGIALLRSLRAEYIVGVHFPYIVPPAVLKIPSIGVLNLHPAYLPFNRGWHTPSWAILEGTPIGATLHFMDTGVDTGDIVHQRHLEVTPQDTADTLYARIKRLELEVFAEAWPGLVQGDVRRMAQDAGEGTFHKRSDLFNPEVQKINLDERVSAADLLRKLRALTTNSIAEAAYFERDGKRYRIQVKVTEDPGNIG